MCGKPFLVLCAAILLSSKPSGCDASLQADDCTSGFVSLDRMEAAVQGGSESEDHVLGDVFPSITSSGQAILPHINFTCDGSILSWTFGAQWEGNSPRLTELQIWRSSGDGSYTKVKSTTIMLEEENSTQLYQYTLTSPLPFQAGDILGFFQGNRLTSQFRLLFEDTASHHQIYYVLQDRPSNQFTISSNTETADRYHLLIGVETNPAGCDCGFMSPERIRILLGLKTVGDRVFSASRQQITPNIKFTCDGLITKWIFGANWVRNGLLYPELQVWRNLGNVYHKINGTVINTTMLSQTRIYEYDKFSPIPFLAGDILGVFLPQTQTTKLRLWSERGNGPIVYYIDTGNATVSPVDTINLQHVPSLSSTSYLPLVTVEISRLSKSQASSPLSSKSPDFTPLPSHTIKEEISTLNNESRIVGVGVAGALLVLITIAIIIITVLVYLRRMNKVNITDNVAYLSSTSEVNLSLSIANTATGDHSPTSHDHEYMYVTTAATSKQQVNNTTPIRATNIPTVTGVAHTIPTSTNVAYAIPTSTNPAYESTVTTSTSQKHQAAPHQSGSDVRIYDCIS